MPQTNHHGKLLPVNLVRTSFYRRRITTSLTPLSAAFSLRAIQCLPRVLGQSPLACPPSRTDVLVSGIFAGRILVGSYLDLSQQFRQISGGTPKSRHSPPTLGWLKGVGFCRSLPFGLIRCTVQRCCSATGENRPLPDVPGSDFWHGKQTLKHDRRQLSVL